MGRMGNQMFQYAAAKCLSVQHGFISSLSHLDKLVYFELSTFERINNKLKSFLFFRVWKPIWGLKTLNTQLDCLKKSYFNELTQIDSPTTVWGFFQSPEYFDSLSDRIKKEFRVKKEFKKDLAVFFKENGIEAGKYVAIHLRRTDYKGFTVPGLQGDDFTLPLSYYTNALKMFPHSAALPIVFVSDDPDSIEALFPEIEHKIISRNNAITDFLILQQAAQLIISNSTYAWWAAYTNPFIKSEVFCPKYFLGFKENLEIPIHIYPSDWNQINVY